MQSLLPSRLPWVLAVVWTSYFAWSSAAPAFGANWAPRRPERQATSITDEGNVPPWQRPPGRRSRASVEPQSVNRRVAHEYYVEEMPAEGEEVMPGTPDEMIGPGEIEEIPDDGVVIYEEGQFENCDDCSGDDCTIGCQDGSRFGRYCDGICIPRRIVEETSVSIGTQAFKGPLDQGQNGNFGFHEGVSFGGPFGTVLGFGPLGIGYQIGAQFTQSNFSGSQAVVVRDTQRDQSFLTAGFFRRNPRRWGWQYGVVYDWMNDTYYVDINLSQIRVELSWLLPNGHEIGYWGAHRSRRDSEAVGGVDFTFESINLYTLFYRYNLPNGAFCRAWGGATSEHDGLLGVDFRVPLSNRWDLTGGVNYLIPEQSGGVAGSSEESWGLSMNLTWYVFRGRCGVHNGLFRPLFSVADNNVFMVDQFVQ